MNDMHTTLDANDLDQLFLQARSHNGWRDQPVTDEEVQRLYALARMGPTANNSSPARFVFVRTAEGKERLRPHLAPNNVAKVMGAPLVVVVAHDLRFFDRLPQLFPAYDAAAPFRDNPALVQTAALRNGSFQGAYLMLAARAMGLDCGPIGGFQAAALDADLFAGTDWKSNFLCTIGHGDPAKLRPRGPRLAFDEACREL
jgi:3-hydroxypropanoate dehydrogenase